MARRKLEEIGVSYLNGNVPKRKQKGDPSVYPQGYFNDKECRWCDALFSPITPAELYCCDSCKDNGNANNRLINTYGITVDDYITMWEEQKGLCRVCLTKGWTMAEHHQLKLVVDHNHDTGKVRGLLCHNCNRGLGLLQEDLGNIKRALEYVESGQGK